MLFVQGSVFPFIQTCHYIQTWSTQINHSFVLHCEISNKSSCNHLNPRCKPPKSENVTFLTSLLVVLTVFFVDFHVWSDFDHSFLCLWTSLRRNLSEDRENYDQSQTKTWKSTKKTVKTTTKVRQNYELGGQKKMKKPKFLENGGFLWKIRHSRVN